MRDFSGSGGLRNRGTPYKMLPRDEIAGLLSHDPNGFAIKRTVREGRNGFRELD
jgi:hypothetical protein